MLTFQLALSVTLLHCSTASRALPEYMYADTWQRNLVYLKLTLRTLFQDGLVDTLKRSRIKFVQCLVPHANAGLSETMVPTYHSSPLPQPECLIDVPLLRNQVTHPLVHGMF